MGPSQGAGKNKQVNAENARLTEEKAKLTAENAALSRQLEEFRQTLEKAKGLIPVVIENGALGRFLNGEKLEVEAKLIPGTQAHLDFLNATLDQIDAKSNLLIDKLQEIQKNYSLYESEKRAAILQLQEEKKGLFDLIKGFMPAELTRQQWEKSKAAALRTPCPVQKNTLEERWKSAQKQEEQQNLEIDYFEKVVFPMQKAKTTAEGFCTVAKDIEEWRRKVFKEAGALDSLRQMRTDLRSSATALAECWDACRRLQIFRDGGIEKAIQTDYETCRTHETYTHFLLDVIEFEKSLLKPLNEILWVDLLTEAQNLTRVQGFYTAVEKFCQVKQQYDTCFKTIAGFSKQYLSRMQNLEQQPVQEEKSKELLRQHAHALKTVWSLAETTLRETQLTLQQGAYIIGTRIEEHMGMIRSANVKEIALLRHIQGQNTFSISADEERLIEAAQEVWTLQETFAKLIGHLKSFPGGTNGLFVPVNPSHHSTLKSSNPVQDGDAREELQKRFSKFCEKTLDFYKAAFELRAIWEILKAHLAILKQASNLVEMQQALIPLMQKNLGMSGSGTGTITALIVEQETLATRMQEINKLSQFDQGLQKTQEEWEAVVDSLGETMKVFNYSSFAEVTKKWAVGHLAILQKNERTLKDLADRLNWSDPSKKVIPV